MGIDQLADVRVSVGCVEGVTSGVGLDGGTGTELDRQAARAPRQKIDVVMCRIIIML